MKSRLTFCAVLLATIATTLFASEREVQVLKSTAAALDSLVSQTKTTYQEEVRPGFKAERKIVRPVSLNKITPVIAARTRLSEAQLKELLVKDQPKLSEIVMARFLEESGGKTWTELLAEHKTDDLVRLIEERRITTRVKDVLDELYTEVSFAALDAMEDSARGNAPRGAKGQGRSGK